jgi:MscS family membrane protein
MLVDFGRAPLIFVGKFWEWLRHRARAGVVISLFAVALSAAAQLPSVTPKSPPPVPATQESVSDPLGRSTPRGTIHGFIKAVDRNDFVTAVQYLQVPGKSKHEAEALARDLKELMNRYFSRPLAIISDSPEGEPQDALPFDHERVGSLKINDKKVDVVLVRVADPRSAGRIWLISSETLANVPDLFDMIQENWIDRFMPEVLLTHALFSISLAQWMVWFASFAVPLLVFGFISKVTVDIFKKTVKNEQRRTVIESWDKAVRWPVVSILTLLVNVLVVHSLGLSLTSRIILGRFVLVLLIIGVVWLLRRTMTLSFERIRAAMRHTGDTGKQSLILLAERLLRVVIILVAIFSILTIVGVDTRTALAGVGIGGVAIAFGAQKTVENLLGGIFLLTDKALAIGDKCRIGDRVGTVEDITLRSIRLRTPEQTLLSIPAGGLSQSNIENFASRGKIPVQTTLELRYGTTTEQLKSILDMIRRLLAESPGLETATARAQLTSYGPNSIQVELFAYVTTRDEAKFRAIREDLLLRIGEVVDNSGSGFAAPAQIFYVRRQGETHQERTSVSEIPGPGAKDQKALRDEGRTSEEPRAVPSALPAEGQVLPRRAG